MSVNYAIIGADNGLAPTRRQAIIWSNVAMLLIVHLGKNFREVSREIHWFSFKKMRLNMSCGKIAAILSRSQCVNLTWGSVHVWSGADRKLMVWFDLCIKGHLGETREGQIFTKMDGIKAEMSRLVRSLHSWFRGPSADTCKKTHQKMLVDWAMPQIFVSQLIVAKRILYESISLGQAWLR